MSDLLLKLSLTLAQFKIPGEGGSQEVEVPGGVPDELKGGTGTAAKLIQLGLDWLFLIAAFLAVIFIMYSGIQWITSQGDPGKIASAKRRLMFAIIGLIVVASSFFIVRVIITITGGDASFFNNVNNINPTN